MTRTNNTDRKDVWQTPDELLDNITEPIDLDPCAGADTTIGDTNWHERGTQRRWFGTVFVNPPFSMKTQFLKHAVAQQSNTDCIYVVTPDSTDVKSWWHNTIAPHSDYVWFSEGRIAYVNPNTGEQAGSPTFGTALSIFGEPPAATLTELDASGHLVETYTP